MKQTLSLFFGVALSVGLSKAAVTISSTTPTINGADIGELSYTSTLSDKTWTDTPNHGQSFTTGSNTSGYTISSVSFQVNGTSQQDPAPANKTWSIRLVSIAGDNATTTTIALETGHVSSGAWSAGDWFTFSLNSPVALNADTLYGIDVEMTAGGAYQPGIPYFRYNNSDSVAGSYRYTRADGNPTSITANTTRDRVFHIDMAANPIPEPSVALLSGLGVMLLLRRRKR